MSRYEINYCLKDTIELLKLFKMSVDNLPFSGSPVLINRIQNELEYLSNNETLFDTWNIIDVRERRESLTDEQCKEVLLYIENNADCNEGINWDFIDHAIERLFGEEY